MVDIEVANNSMQQQNHDIFVGPWQIYFDLMLERHFSAAVHLLNSLYPMRLFIESEV